MRFVTLLEYLALTSALVGIFFVAGFPLQTLARHIWGERWFVPAPVIGVLLLQMATWYWFVIGRDGTGIPATTVVAVGAVLTAGILVRRFRDGGVAALGMQRLGLAAGTALASAVVLGTNFAYLLTLPRPTSATLGNNDVAAYAMKAAHLLRYGFDDYGAIIGDNLGVKTRTDAFGSSTIVSAFSALTHISVGRLMMVVIFVFVGVMVHTLTMLILELRPGHPVIAVLASAAAATTVLFVYSIGQYFLGQVMAMSVLPLVAIGTIRAAGELTKRQRAGLVTALAVPVMVMMSHYFHMAFLSIPVIAPPAVVATVGLPGPREFMHRVARVAVTGLGGLALGVALVPQWVIEGYRQAKMYAGVTAGWPLATYWPVEIMGFMKGITPVMTTARWVWSLVLVLAFVAGLVALRRSSPRLVGWAAAGIALIALSYVVLVHQYGDGSYKQWKWITFFQPIAVVPVLVVLATGAAELTRRWVVTERRREFGAVAIVAGLGIAVWTNPGTDPRPVGVASLVAMRDKPAALVEEEYYDLRSYPEIASQSTIDIQVGANWPSMWAAVMLYDKKVALLQETYFAVAQPTGTERVTPAEPTIDSPGVTRLDNLFDISPATTAAPTILSTDRSALAGSVEVTGQHPGLKAVTHVDLILRNSGSAAWILTEGKGTVHVAARLLDADGNVVDENWFRSLIAPATVPGPVPAGSTVHLALQLPAAPKPGMSAQLSLVSEQVAWFGSTVNVDLGSAGSR